MSSKTVIKPQSAEEHAIVDRYKMSVDVWRKSLRTDLFHSLLPNSSTTLCMVLLAFPIAYLTTQMSNEEKLLKTVYMTLVLSVIAGLLSGKLILVFKDMLCQKNLFGKDLNKAGVKEDKPPV